MATQTFELVSPFLSIYAPSRTYGGDPAHLKGQTNNALVTGELLSMNSNYGVERGVSALADAPLKVPAFVYFSETGRGDLITGGKVPVLQFGPYEADTMVFERDANGALLTAGGGALSSSDIGKAVGVGGVRHPTKYADNSIVLAGLQVLSDAEIAAGAFIAGRISRITGTGANMKVRVFFGI